MSFADAFAIGFFIIYAAFLLSDETVCVKINGQKQCIEFVGFGNSELEKTK